MLITMLIFSPHTLSFSATPSTNDFLDSSKVSLVKLLIAIREKKKKKELVQYFLSLNLLHTVSFGDKTITIFETTLQKSGSNPLMHQILVRSFKTASSPKLGGYGHSEIALKAT